MPGLKPSVCVLNISPLIPFSSERWKPDGTQHRLLTRRALHYISNVSGLLVSAQMSNTILTLASHAA
ncbi:hypothetical protein EYF80_029642 [Liparis tanakae]|uniref:Uncharacterized protein n=1 Tax=Liparis tanakae TaxID=230148 RepID=A0A4Z2H3P4_9TELE|nr:hypothetical protein EYF80_029642 [Liparis tanakae]